MSEPCSKCEGSVDDGRLTSMLDRTRVDNGAPETVCLLRRHVHDPLPEPLLVAPDIPPDTLAFTADVRLVHAFLAILYVCRDGGLLPVEQELVRSVRELRVGVRYAPERPEHTTEAAGAEYLYARTAFVWGRGVGGTSSRWFGDAQGVTQEGEKTHGVVRYQTLG